MWRVMEWWECVWRHCQYKPTPHLNHGCQTRQASPFHHLCCGTMRLLAEETWHPLCILPAFPKGHTQNFRVWSIPREGIAAFLTKPPKWKMLSVWVLLVFWLTSAVRWKRFDFVHFWNTSSRTKRIHYWFPRKPFLPKTNWKMLSLFLKNLYTHSTRNKVWFSAFLEYILFGYT